MINYYQFYNYYKSRQCNLLIYYNSDFLFIDIKKHMVYYMLKIFRMYGDIR